MNSTTTTTIGDRFGEVLEQLKRERKIKQQGSIAVNTGYTVATMSEIKAGRMQLPEKIITYLHAKFNVNPDYLIMGELPMFGKTPKREETQKAPEEKEPIERIYLVESVRNLSETEKINAKNIERLIGLLELQYNKGSEVIPGKQSTPDPANNVVSSGFGNMTSGKKKNAGRQ